MTKRPLTPSRSRATMVDNTSATGGTLLVAISGIDKKRRRPTRGLGRWGAWTRSGIHLIWVVVVCIVAVLLRLYHLTVSGLTVTESYALTFRREPPLARLGSASISAGYTTAYLTTLHLWCDAFGTTPFTARVFSVCCGVLTLPLLYILARLLVNRLVALYTLIFVALNPLALMYSQQISPYAFLTLLATFTVLMIVMLLRRSSFLPLWLVFASSMVALLMVNVLSILLVMVILVIGIIAFRFSPRGLCLMIGSFVLSIGVFVFVTDRLHIAQDVAVQQGALNTGLLVLSGTVAAFVGWTGMGVLSPWIALLVAPLDLLGLTFLNRLRYPRSLGIIAGWLGYPLLLFLLSFVAPVYSLPLAFISLPPFVILGTGGMVWLSRIVRRNTRRIIWLHTRPTMRRWAVRIATYGVLTFSLAIGVLFYARLDQGYFTRHRGEAWPQVATLVARDEESDDAIMLANPGGYTQLAFDDYYGPLTRHVASPLSQLVYPLAWNAVGTTAASNIQAQRELQLDNQLAGKWRVWIIVREDGNAAWANGLMQALPQRYVLSSQTLYLDSDYPIYVYLWTTLTFHPPTRTIHDLR